MRVRAYAVLLIPTSHHFSYYPPDPTHTMSGGTVLMEMPGAFEWGQYGLTRPDVVRFVIDTN